MNERGQQSKYDKAPVSLFVPGDDALGDVHSMSFNSDGILIDCRVIRPNWLDGFVWLFEHYQD